MLQAPLPFVNHCRLCADPAIEGTPFCERHQHVKQSKPPRNPYGGRGAPKGQPFEPTNNREWWKFSRQFLKENPWCCRCRTMERWTAARVTDHVIPARKLYAKDPSLIYDKTWLQPLCQPCHGTKTLHERRGQAYDYRSTPTKCYLLKK